VAFARGLVRKNACRQVVVGYRTDIGLVRKNNEDTCRVLAALKLFIISDGMGGESHGELASAIAGDTIALYCSELSEAATTSCEEHQLPGLSDKTRRLASAVRHANRKIHETALANPQLRGMGATVVAAWLDGPRLSLVHVGDSRAYVLRSGILQPLTSDHTLIAEQIKRGLMKPEEARSSKLQNVLIRALGVQEQVELDATEFMLVHDDVLLLCTDGLTRMVPDPEISSALASRSFDPQTSADNLISLANRYGGEDNISVIVVHITEV
jgi:serine/threonine protein phosphatase PrpC